MQLAPLRRGHAAKQVVKPALLLKGAAYCRTTTATNGGTRCLDPGCRVKAVHSHPVTLAGHAHPAVAVLLGIQERMQADLCGGLGGASVLSRSAPCSMGVVNQSLHKGIPELLVRVGGNACPFLHGGVDDVRIGFGDSQQCHKHPLLPVVGAYSVLDGLGAQGQLVEPVHMPEL